MSSALLITDNVTELLVKIIEFTRHRHKILAQNISNINSPGFVPRDLAAEEFSDLLDNAIDEHITNHRLMLRDTENIKFGFEGAFEVKPVVDIYARELLRKSRDDYIELQVSKLLENTINQRLAAELLRQKRGMVSVFQSCDLSGCFVKRAGANRR
jgi:flagellar basal body rod protein FlgB